MPSADPTPSTVGHDAVDPDLLGDLVACLREGATPAPPWLLTQRQRWEWLTETLLGHPRVRGGQRPRDFPADPGGRRIVGCALRFQKLRIGSWDGVPAGLEVGFGEWLRAFVLMVEGNLFRRSVSLVKMERAALTWVIWQILRAAEGKVEEGSYHRLLAVLGMNLRDVCTLKPKGPKCEEEVCIAAEAALLAAVDAEHGSTFVPATSSSRSKKVEEFLTTSLQLVTLKPHKVQPYLDRAKLVWAQRGASVWTAQALASARELLAERGRWGSLASSLDPGSSPAPSRLILLTDVDALSLFASFEPLDGIAFRDHLKESLKAVWSIRGYRSGQLVRHHPRLSAFLDTLTPSMLEGHPLMACLPDFCLEVSESLTIRELCRRRQWLPKPDQEQQNQQKEEKGMRAFLRLRRAGTSGGSCAYVRGEQALVDVDQVPWLQGRKEKPRIGWTGIVWALASATYRMHVAQGLGEKLGIPGLPVRNQHKEWMKTLAGTDPAPPSEVDMAYVKLDGDSVGETLGRLPGLQAPGVGLRIMASTFDKLAGGVRGAIRQWEAAHPGKSIGTLPIDLVYLGGDDLMCHLPTYLLDAFLQGFRTEGNADDIPTFSGVVIHLPGQIADGAAVPLVAAELVPRALKWVKDVRRGKVPQAESLSSLQSLARKQGFRLTAEPEPRLLGPNLAVWHFHLEPHAEKEDASETLVSRAQHFAMDAHAGMGQLRKYTNDPYATHLAAVAERVSRVPGCSKEMIAAAWLHDVLEDVPRVSFPQLQRQFGARVARLVLELTDVSRAEDGNRAIRKAKDRDHLAKASPEAQTIKLADLLDNAGSILAHDKAFSRVFMREMAELLGVLTQGDPDLHRQAQGCLARTPEPR